MVIILFYTTIFRILLDHTNVCKYVSQSLDLFVLILSQFDFIVTVDLESLLPEALKEIPQFCAIKFTDSNLLRMNFIQKNFGKQLKVFTGYDEMLLAAKTSLNIDAAICATFNLEENCRSYLQMLDLIDRNSLLEARECQNKISKVCERLREGENFFQNLKTYLQRNLHSRGIQVGNVRSPISID